MKKIIIFIAFLMLLFSKSFANTPTNSQNKSKANNNTVKKAVTTTNKQAKPANNNGSKPANNVAGKPANNAPKPANNNASGRQAEFNTTAKAPIPAERPIQNTNKKSFISKQNEFYIGAGISITKDTYHLKGANVQNPSITINNDIPISSLKGEAENITSSISSVNQNISFQNIELERENKVLEIYDNDSKRLMQIMTDDGSCPERCSQHIRWEEYLELQAKSEAVSISIEKIKNSINQLTENLASLESENQSILGEIEELIASNGGLTSEGRELFGIKEKANSVNIFSSISIGFIHHFDQNISFGEEIGIDFGKIVIGSNSRQELEVRSNIGIFALLKAGYKFEQNAHAFLNLGILERRYGVKYTGNNAGINSSDYVAHFLIGIGAENRIAPEIGIFAEINYLSPINVITIEKLQRDLKVSSTQLKVGVKYYFKSF